MKADDNDNIHTYIRT